jgi:hypothetical protein
MVVALAGFSPPQARSQPVDLIKRYPTQMVAGDTAPAHARPWSFSNADLFRLTGFRLQVGTELLVELGPTDLGVGHCVDGAVWAVLIPRAGGKLTSQAASEPEAVAHVWLRFHPKEIEHLFPPETVFGDGATNLTLQMRFIANGKFTSSWHAGLNATIPEPNVLTVDVDTVAGRRRFFTVDSKAGTAEYIAPFEARAIKSPPSLTMDLAQAAFDQLWEAFDRDYAQFGLRPEVDWARLREQYRPRATACKSTYEFAGMCAEMLSELRDLHVRLTLAGVEVPTFNRVRAANSNPSAHRAILGGFVKTGRVQWKVTADKIGYLAVDGWTDREITEQVDRVLEQMRDTRGLIFDVRLNGGGSESTARDVAGRFVPKDFVYAYNQVRNGPKHSNLAPMWSRTVTSRGPWRYNRPVVLLIGQKCMSSNESFIAMMTGDPDLTTMGAPTCGSSGNPKVVHLPIELTVNVPSWIDYLPDKTPLDEHGIQPQVNFKPVPGAFEGGRDDLLTAALERLRQTGK